MGKRKLPLKQLSLNLLYDDSDVSADPRKKDKDNNKNLLEKYDNNEVYVCLKLDKIKQLVNKRSTSKKKEKSYNSDEDDDNDI